jgi:hypothetical protein
METSLALPASVRAAFAQLIDYAGLFPPAQLPMAQAALEYAAARDGAYAWVLGRFIVPAARIEELAAHRPDFELSVIANVTVSAGHDTGRWIGDIAALLSQLAAMRDRGVRIAALEVPLPRLRAARETYHATIGQLGAALDACGLRALPVYVEMPRDARWLDELADATAAAKRAGLGAKVRCGGMEATAYPSVAELAAFVRHSTEAGTPFKATAGLHHPVRHHNAAAGVTMHGFLNLLAAAAFAAQAGDAVLEAILSEEDAAAFRFDERGFAWRDLRIATAELERVRREAFVGYGSCSFSEPVEDLRTLGILAVPA